MRGSSALWRGEVNTLGGALLVCVRVRRCGLPQSP